MGLAVSDMDMKAEGFIGEFEGSPVIGTAVEVRNAGGGLNKSLETDPKVLADGDTVYVVMQCDVNAINFKHPKDHEDQWLRVHVMRATDVTFLDHAAVKKAIEEQRDRNKKFQEAKAGIVRLPLKEEDEAAIAASSNGK